MFLVGTHIPKPPETNQPAILPCYGEPQRGVG